MSSSLSHLIFPVGNNLKKLCSVIIMAFFCLGISFEFSDAASRFGGGRSFGGGGGFSSPAPKQPTRSFDQGSAKQGAPGAGAMAQTPGRFGFGSGMLGGLLMGGLLGSLFMGGGFHGMNMMDILIIGALIYFGLKLFRSWQARQQDSGGHTARNGAPGSRPGPGNGPGGSPTGSVADSVRDQWERLRSRPDSGSSASGGPAAASSGPRSGFGSAVDAGQGGQAAPSVSVPEGFDTNEFLNGAKAAYVRLQEAWGKRDLAAVSPLLTREMQAEVREQFANSPAEGPTEILLVEAELTNFTRRGSQENASVLFSVLLREAGKKDSEDVSELWTFTRGRGENWLLDGLQQVEK